MRIIVFGAGLAGLAAGIKILEERPGWEVTVYNMGHHIGGRASSWQDQNDYNINHGFHSIFQNYTLFKGLLKKSSINLKKTLVSSKSGYFFEEDTGKIHQFGSLINFYSLRNRFKNGYTIGENLKYASFLSKNYLTIFKQKDIEQYDDICFTQWALENGADPGLVKKRSFRLTKDALFNWPEEISAYIAMKSFRLLGQGKIFHVNGTYGEQIIAPVARYFERLGGKFVLHQKLIRLHTGDRKVTGFTIGKADPEPHDYGKKAWGTVVPVLAGTEKEVTDFDDLIVAVPLDNFKELNPGDPTFWAHFEGPKNLRSVSTINWQIWLEKKAMPSLKTSINGLDEPMGTVIDHKPIIDAYKNDRRFGSVLEFVGQETGYETYTDAQLKEIVLSNFLKLPGVKDIRTCGIIHESFRRNRSNHQRYLLTDPGTLQFRPFSNTHFHNLFLAGDWIRNEIDVPTMEGAVCAGYTAAGHILKKYTK